MTKVKICGLFREEDIEYVNELLPDYVGFVFANSRRQVSPKKAEHLIKKLNKNIKTVGVFVNEDILKVNDIGNKLHLDVLQFHGKEDKEYIDNFQEFICWKAMSIKVAAEDKNFSQLDIYNEEINRKNKYNIEAMVLDSSVKGTEGGTGINFDWNIIPRMNINKKLILAGGLNINNLEEALKKVKPYAVDVSSGVETEGVKDFNKIKRFIEKVRNI